VLAVDCVESGEAAYGHSDLGIVHILKEGDGIRGSRRERTGRSDNHDGGVLYG
jgi:hypothetical protein